MLKKLLLTLLILGSIAQAKVEIGIFDAPGGWDGGATRYDPMNMKEQIHFHFLIRPIDGSPEIGDKDWIAIYKKDAPNNAENILAWEYGGFFNPDTQFLAGDYEVRFYRNDSYEIDTSLDLKFVEDNNRNPFINIDKRDHNSISFSSYKSYEAWIGLYKKGTSNGWNNVISWARQNTDDNIGYKYNHDRHVFETFAKTTLDLTNIPNGNYEARLFYNNSFNKEASINVAIHHTYLAEIEYQKIEDDEQFQHQFSVSNYTPKSLDWIAYFNEGDKHISENVVDWEYVDGKSSFKNGGLPTGKYTFVLFLNDSYNELVSINFENK